MSKLTSLTNEEFNSTINIKVIAFVVFVISICIAYLALWMPFVLKMTKDVSLMSISIYYRCGALNQCLALFLLKLSLGCQGFTSF